MLTREENAALLCSGLLHDLVSVQEVVGWADAEIAARERPHPALIEVAMGGRLTPGELASELDPLTRGCDEGKQIDRLLGLMYRRLSRDPKTAPRIASTLYSFAYANLLPGGGDPGGHMFYLDDALDLASSGVYGTVEGVLEEMLQYLAPYADSAPVQLITYVVGSET
jgi:hypothetical protein